MDMREYGRVFCSRKSCRKPAAGSEKRSPNFCRRKRTPHVRLGRLSVAALMPELGPESNDWLGKPVLLTYRSDLINSKETMWIDVTPINEEVHQ